MNSPGATHPPGSAHVTDQASGGAAEAAKRLAASLRHEGLRAEWWTFGSRAPTQGGTAPDLQLEENSGQSALERLAKNISKRAGREFRRKRQQRLLLEALRRRRPDILHLHNLHASALRHRDLAAIPPETPIVWTMHDCWAALPWAYRWENAGGKDEFQGRDEEVDYRIAFFAAPRKIAVVCPSKWLAGIARKQLGAHVRVEHIPYGVPLDVFTPQPREAARQSLEAAPDRFCIGFAAASFDRRKGGDILAESLARLPAEKISLLLWGNDEGIAWPADITIHRAGYIRDERTMAALYSACDVFACPSRADNLPNTILESLACGTPVAGSRAGGIPDMVRPGQTGWLFEPGNAASCADSLREAMKSKADNRNLTQGCRALVESEYTPALQATRYAALYRDLAGNTE